LETDIFSSILKNARAYYNAGVVLAVKSKVVGLAPGFDPTTVSYSAIAFKKLQRHE
jgi:hypothetical protein